MPCVLNAADEEAVEAFLKGKLSFSKIYPVVENVVLKHKSRKSPGLADIKAADDWARKEARDVIRAGAV
jgi:1-deoxy-D-xylulose-5-phosphate reductoisomerase